MGPSTGVMPSPAVWPWLGPPTPTWVKIAARLSMLSLLGLTVLWISKLGGLSLSPDVTVNVSGNNTGRLFNWHPLLMVLAFGVFMPEAILSYRSSLAPGSSR